MDELARRRKQRRAEQRDDRERDYATIGEDVGVARGMVTEAIAAARDLGDHKVHGALIAADEALRHVVDTLEERRA